MILDRLNSRKFNIQHLEIEIRTFALLLNSLWWRRREGGCRFRKVVTISKFREAKDFKEKYSLLITSKQLDVYHAWRGSAKNCIRIEPNYAKFITTFKAEPITSCDFQRWLVADFTLEHAPKLPSNFRHAASRVILSDAIRVCRYVVRAANNALEYIGIICARAAFHSVHSDNVPIKSLRVSC